MSTSSRIHISPPGLAGDTPSAPRFKYAAALLACILGIAALTSAQENWQPVSLVVALGVLMIAADALPVPARLIRLSASLMIQVVAMALLGPAPAVAIGLAATLVEALISRTPLRGALHNAVVFGLLGLIGGLAFQRFAEVLELDRDDTGYALLVAPIYAALATLNLLLVAHYHGLLAGGRRLQMLRDTALPALPLEALSCVVATASVLLWAHAGLAAVAALLVLLVIILPLARAVSHAERRGDDLIALRDVSDRRAAEVARLASDRDRLLSELVDAEQRERARLAETLHDGPLQRLVALRQDAAAQEGPSWREAASNLDRTIAETRAIISAFHPEMIRELGFEASLRAAIAPFPAAQSVELTIRIEDHGPSLVDALLLPVAQELLVNSIKHANPSVVQIRVRTDGERVVLEVSDDGIGIDTSDAAGAVQAGHLGLAMVRRRVENAGGTLSIETRRDGGTLSRVSLP